MPHKIRHLSYSDAGGGAARAAFRIHQSLCAAGLDSRMWVTKSIGEDPTVDGPASKFIKALDLVRIQSSLSLVKTLKTGNPIIHSPAIFPSRWVRRINTSDADVFNLHWVQSEMLSISDISRLRKPLVWTLHDMWAFCGAEHVTSDYRWRDGYLRANRPAHESGFDLNRYTWQRKQKYWRRPVHIVCPSEWLAHCVRTSALMHTWPVSVIPNPINIDRWKPVDRCLARDLFGLPQNCPLLLFGAMGGGKDPNKGFDLLLAALAYLRNDPTVQNLHLVVFGQHAPQSPLQLGFPVHYTGHLHDDLSLRVLYSAADVMLVPSRHEAFGQTASEAHACGTPVVAFSTSGLRDVVEDRITGALAHPFKPKSFAEAIRWVLEDEQRRQALGVAARDRAVRLWNPGRVAGLYTELYMNAMVQY